MSVKNNSVRLFSHTLLLQKYNINGPQCNFPQFPDLIKKLYHIGRSSAMPKRTLVEKSFEIMKTRSLHVYKC